MGVKKKKWTQKEALLCIPKRNAKAEEISRDNGNLVLLFPVVYKPFFLRLWRMLRLNPKETFNRKIELDCLGADVWSLIDSKRDVKTIIKSFASLHALDNREAQISVTLFLRSLGEKGLISINDP